MDKKEKSKSYLRLRRKNTYAVRLKILTNFFVVMTIFLGIAFVASINNLSIQGFILQDLKIKVSELEYDNKELELEAMQLESYDNVVNRAQDLKMVKVDAIDYISVTDELVAKK